MTTIVRNAHHFAAHAPAGVVKNNQPIAGLDLNVPFSGVKNSPSNTFREQDTAAMTYCTWTKAAHLGYE